MDYLENEFNKRFKDQKLPFDQATTEDLWKDISTDLDNDPNLVNTTIFPRQYFISTLIVIFTALASVYLLLNTTENKSNDTSITSTKKTTDFVENSLPANSSSLSANATPQLKQQAINKKISLEKQNITLSNNKEINTNTKAIEETPLTYIKPISKNSNFNENKNELLDFHQRAENNIQTKPAPTPVNNNLRPIITPPFHDTTNDLQTGLEENTSKTVIALAEDNPTKNKRASNTLTKSFDPLHTTTSSLNIDKYKISISPTASQENEDPELKHLPNWQLFASTGINTVLFNYSSTVNPALADLKSTSEKMYLGSSYALHLGTTLKNKWTLRTGIEYHQLWSKFDYYYASDYQLVKENVLVKILEDATTGAIIEEIYDSVTVNVSESRTIVHYNNYQRFSIPLLAGFQSQRKNFSYGISIGPILNFTNSQIGKGLDNQAAITNFSDSNFPTPFENMDLSMVISPHLGYNITEKWQLIIEPQWKWNQAKNLSDTDFIVNIHQFNLNVGLGYRF